MRDIECKQVKNDCFCEKEVAEMDKQMNPMTRNMDAMNQSILFIATLLLFGPREIESQNASLDLKNCLLV
jgi:hypothetical protein